MDRRFRLTQFIAMVLAVGLLSTTGLQAAKSAPRMIPDNFSALAEQVGPRREHSVEKSNKGEEAMRSFGRQPLRDERFKDFFGKQMPPAERRRVGSAPVSIIGQERLHHHNNHVVETPTRSKVKLRTSASSTPSVEPRPQTDGP